MALEDRCSPQSAPSPPGIPHSPQSTSSPLILDMSLHNNSSTNFNINGSQHLNSLYPASPCDAKQKNMDSTGTMFSEQQKQIRQNSIIDDRLSPQSSSDGVATIKEEENDSILGDIEERDNENESTNENGAIERHHSSSPPPPPPPVPAQIPIISFSITDILSDRFGRRRTCLEKKSTTGAIFRPFEVTTTTTTKNSNSNENQSSSYSPSMERTSAFTRLTSDVIDYSRNTTAVASVAAAAAAAITNPAAAAMLVDRANFLNCFNPAAYPRIHEEILNSTKKFNKQQHHHHATNNNHHGFPQHSLQQQYHHLQHQQHSPSDNMKMPPLGSLCKTVSQIGQPPSSTLSAVSSNSGQSGGLCMSSPPPGSSMSMSSASSSVTSPSPSCRLPTSPQPIPPQSVSRDSGMESSDDTRSETSSTKDDNGQPLWPAWVYCTRYSDRPSSGPRYRRPKKPKDKTQNDEKRPRTAFSSEQLARLKREFNENRYLTERRRQQLSSELGLNEAQIKIWFQNKRAKIKKSSGTKNPLALQLMAQGLYNHSTVPLTKEEEELEMRMNGQL